MGLVTAVSSAIQGASSEVSGVTSETLPALGVSEVAGLVVTVALLYLLAYLNILEAAEADASLRHKIAALATPLFFTFAGIVIYHSLVALRWFGIP